MRLSEWRVRAPVRDALGTKVLAVVKPVLGVLGVEDDPQAWVHWGDDPRSRFTIYTPIAAGLVVVSVRVNMGDAGPRATAKMVRWSRLQIGDVSVETEGSHRMIGFQLESVVLRGADDVADAVGRFALVLFAAAEGRPWPSFDAAGHRRRNSRTGAGKTGAAKAAAAKRAAAKASGTKSATSPKAAPGAGRAPRGANAKLPALPARTASSSGTGSAGSRSTIDRRRSPA